LKQSGAAACCAGWFAVGSMYASAFSHAGSCCSMLYTAQAAPYCSAPTVHSLVKLLFGASCPTPSSWSPTPSSCCLVLHVLPHPAAAATHCFLLLPLHCDRLHTQLPLSKVVISKPPTVTMPIGTPGNYTITVSNIGGAPAPNVTLLEVLPPGLQFVSGPPGCSVQALAIACVIGDMAPGSNTTITLAVRPTAPGPFTTDAKMAGQPGVTTSTTVLVLRTCAVYAGDGGSFTCPAGMAPRPNITQGTIPSFLNCCVSGRTARVQ
jgi:uncharacterized repeat protein (TIGR01451 family)